MFKQSFRPARWPAALLCALPGLVSADGARDWINLPVDTNLIYLYYNHIESNTQLDTVVPVDGLTLKADMALLRYARSFPVAGKTGGIQVLLPYTWGEMEIDSPLPLLGDLDFSKQGAGDITFVFAANLFGAPAMSKQEFAKATPETLLTAGIFITAPTGEYHRNDRVNFGSNRWVFKPQLSFNHPMGRAMFAVNGNVSFYTENDEYHGDNRLKQDPLGSLEFHYSYNFTKCFWGSLDLFYRNGGETEINGVDQDNAQDTVKLGLSGSYNFTPVDAVAFHYNKTIDEPSGSAEVEVFSINYTHAW